MSAAAIFYAIEDVPHPVEIICKSYSLSHIRLSLVPKLPSKASTNLGAPQKVSTNLGAIHSGTHNTTIHFCQYRLFNCLSTPVILSLHIARSILMPNSSPIWSSLKPRFLRLTSPSRGANIAPESQSASSSNSFG